VRDRSPVLCEANMTRPLDTAPLALTDDQLTVLMNTAGQLHQLDREPYLNAVANLFADRRDIGDGEFNRGMREILRSGMFHWALNPAHASKRDVG
jgi:hypothetical protein